MQGEENKMATFRVNKTSDYTVISNYHLREKEMSLKAKGLLTLMLSLPERWDFSISGLVAICKESESAIKAALKELKIFGYLRIDMIKPDQTKSKKIEYVYSIFEKPLEKGKRQTVKKQKVEKQQVENQPTENQSAENQGQLNTNRLNTKDDDVNKNINTEEQENDTIKKSESNNEHQIYVLDLAKIEMLKLCKNQITVETSLITHRYKIQSLYRFLGKEKFLETFEKIHESSYLQEQARNAGQFFNWLFSNKKENFLSVFNDVYIDKNRFIAENETIPAYPELSEKDFDMDSMWED